MAKLHPRRYRIESLMLEALAPLVLSALPTGIITLRQVTLNKDFSVATIAYSAIGDSAAAVTAQKILEQQAWRYRRQLAQSLNMRKTPQLQFVSDDAGLNADKLRTFLENIDRNNE